MPTTWMDHSQDPNSGEAIAFRQATLRAARRPSVPNRIDYLASLAVGKRVLDVGVVNHTIQATEDPNWLHGRIRKVASYALGVDVLEAPVRALQDAGYNVRMCDITRDADTIQETFDLIVCGEVIEHLGDPASLFRAAGKLLAPGGRLALTSPNAFYLGRAVRYMTRKPIDSVDHVIFAFPGGIAELAERHGMSLEAYRGVHVEHYRGLSGKLFGALFPVLALFGMNAEARCESLIYECVKPV